MTDDLRIHAAGEPGPASGDFVLYWIQTTHRAHDNFALNFAVEQADALGLPLLVYHGLRHDYPWASDRLHTFILQSVADLYRDFARKGIQYAFYLERSGDDAAARRARGDPSPLVALARRAALVVTDFFPTFIVPRQTRALRSKVETPVVAVDSCTLIPLRYHDREHLTARGIRRVLEEALPHYFYPVSTPEPRIRRAVELPFEPTRPTPETIPALVAACDIDHAVRPVAAFPGGPAAGPVSRDRAPPLRRGPERPGPAGCSEPAEPVPPFRERLDPRGPARGPGSRSGGAVREVPGRGAGVAGAGAQLRLPRPPSPDH